ncbi:ATP-dependent helicase, partial [Candidatus Dojkabacteria bacterium]|nr:ATP-dependent helicase [Candidatus Dojkabacteria bacterium]
NIYNFSELLKKWHKESVSKTLSELFLSIINDSGLLDYVSGRNDKGAGQSPAPATNYTSGRDAINRVSTEDTEFNDLLSLISFHEFIKSVERVNRKITLEEFLKDIELMSENNYVVTSSKIENENGVNLLTAHSSKGLEFKYVFIIHATENNWGSTRKMPSLLVPEIYNEYYDAEEDAASRLEDERRLFFVAITRAKEKLYFTKAKTEINEGSVTNLSTSQFIEELDQNSLEKFSPEDHDIKDSDLLTLLKKPEIESYSIEEEKFLNDRIKNFALSATALNDYIESPLLFKERHLIRIPQAKQKNVVMGTAVHAAMEFLNRALIKDSDLSKITFESLDNIYRATLKREFEGDEEYDETLAEGSNILRKYFDNYIATNKYEIPVEAEYNFGFHNVMLQLAEGDEIKLSGKIDKAELLDKQTNSVRIVDYKTSKPHSENHIKGNTKQSDGRYWRQLVFYKILCEADQNFRPKDKFNSIKYICDEVQIDYLKDDKGKFIKRTFSVTEEDVSKLKEVIKDVMIHIRNLEFPEEKIIKIH